MAPKRPATLVLLLACCVTFAACDMFSRATPPADDEALVREQLGVPPAASLRSLSADPLAAGTFGREGLRIVAQFDVPPAERTSVEAALRLAGWGGLPQPDTSSFRMPPTELPVVTAGVGFCSVGVYVSGQTFTPNPCSALPPHYDRYRVGAFDPSTGVLTVVLKNYY